MKPNYTTEDLARLKRAEPRVEINTIAVERFEYNDRREQAWTPIFWFDNIEEALDKLGEMNTQNPGARHQINWMSQDGMVLNQMEEK